MNKIKTLFLTVAIVISSDGFAQFYEFETRTETYKEFQNGQKIDDDFQNENYYFQLPRWFRLFDDIIDAPLIVGKNGFAVVTTPNFSFAMDPFIAGLKKRDNSSAITGKFDTMYNGSIIAKIQWKNMGLEKHDTGDFVNFQLWINLDSQLVEFRYGPSKVTSDSAFDDGSNQGPQIVLAKLTPDFFTVHEIYAIYEDNGTPKSLYQSFDTYTGAPKEGTLMRFVPNAITSVKTAQIESDICYPNPVVKSFTLQGKYTGNENLKIYDLNGKIVLNVDEILDQRTFSISNLNKGVYILEIKSIDKIVRQKIIKNQ